MFVGGMCEIWDICDAADVDGACKYDIYKGRGRDSLFHKAL